MSPINEWISSATILPWIFILVDLFVNTQPSKLLIKGVTYPQKRNQLSMNYKSTNVTNQCHNSLSYQLQKKQAVKGLSRNASSTSSFHDKGN